MSHLRTIPALSSDAATIIQRLRRMLVDEVLSYGEISALIGRDILGCSHILRTARHRVLKDDAIHTAAIATIGVKRMSSAEAGRALAHGLRRARSAARKGRLRASKLIIDEIPQDERALVFARASLLELIDYGGSAKAQSKALAAAAASDERVLPLRRMLAALKE